MTRATHLQIHDGASDERDHQEDGTGHLEDLDAPMPEEVAGEDKGAAGTANGYGQQGYSVEEAEYKRHCNGASKALMSPDKHQRRQRPSGAGHPPEWPVVVGQTRLRTRARVTAGGARQTLEDFRVVVADVLLLLLPGNLHDGAIEAIRVA